MILCCKSPSKGRQTINRTLNPTSVSVFEDILGIIIAATPTRDWPDQIIFCQGKRYPKEKWEELRTNLFLLFLE